MTGLCELCASSASTKGGIWVMCGCHRQPDIKVKVQSIECFVVFFSADEDCVDAENTGNG